MDRKIGAPHPCETFHIGVSAVSRQALVSRRNSETLTRSRIVTRNLTFPTCKTSVLSVNKCLGGVSAGVSAVSRGGEEIGCLGSTPPLGGRATETLGFPLSRPNRDPVVRMASREDPKPLADCIAELLPNLTTAQETRLDILPNRLGTTCAHCGFQMRGSAEVDGQPVCHTGPPYPDCYRLVTVYREALGSRRPA